MTVIRCVKFQAARVAPELVAGDTLPQSRKSPLHSMPAVRRPSPRDGPIPVIESVALVDRADCDAAALSRSKAISDDSDANDAEGLVWLPHYYL